MRHTRQWVGICTAAVLVVSVPVDAHAQDAGQDQSRRVNDRVIDVVEPDFTLATLPTTLRLPRGSFGFRVTHRFSRPLDGGPGHGNLLEDFFGLDSGALIGLELRYGIAPGTQVGIYRQSNRNIQIFGKHNVRRSSAANGFGLDVFASVEGSNNFRNDYSPTVGVLLSTRVGNRAAFYAEPLWVGNANKPLALHFDPDFSSDDDDALLLGLAARVRVLNTVYAIAEYVPRVTGFASGDDHVSVGVEKRAGGHLFQLNVSNGVGSTPAQLAQGGDRSNWFMGFSITRKLY